MLGIPPSGRLCPMGRLIFTTLQQLPDPMTSHNPSFPYLLCPTPPFHDWWILIHCLYCTVPFNGHCHWCNHPPRSPLTPIPQPLTHFIHTTSPIDSNPPPHLYHRDNGEGRTMWMNFLNHKGNNPSAAHGNAKWHDAHVVLTLTGDKCEVVWLGSVLPSYGIYAPSPLFDCLYLEKWEMEIMREDVREIQSKEFESKLLKGFPSHKRVRVHVNFISKHLILERKVWVFQI